MSRAFLRVGLTASLAATALLVTLFASDLNTARESVVVHEWGTFTSVAGENGAPVEWAPLTGPADLPCFVNRLAQPSVKWAPGFVRMETPVLYFYPRKRTTLSVHVDFPQGWITEWYPRASKVTPNPPTGMIPHDSAIEWNSIEVSPGENPQLPVSKGPSHYFAARNTDAAALRVGDQREKLLFYRGMGGFKVPVRPRFTREGKLEISNAGAAAIPLAIVFENREGHFGYRVAHDIKDAVTLDPPALNASLDHLRQELASHLVEFGLYPKEALAMVETWRDSWFEEGTRVFYIYPRATVDSLLPLRITPAPAGIARVFVGRVEVLSPWVAESINGVLSGGSLAGATKFGRFLDPFVQQMQLASGRQLFPNANLQRARSEISRQVNAGSCVE